jgi:hypothetical protein
VQVRYHLLTSGFSSRDWSRQRSIERRMPDSALGAKLGASQPVMGRTITNIGGRFLTVD